MKPGLFCISLCLVFRLVGQGVSVNEGGQPPYPGAMLDVHSATKGVLLPRTDTLGIANPAEGMIIYDTVHQVFQYYDGVQWLALVTSQSFRFWWLDKDGDGFGHPHYVTYAPVAPTFYVNNYADCDDDHGEIYPGATEYCDGVDNDCDGLTDESDPMVGTVCGSDVGTCEPGIYQCIDGVLTCFGEIPPSMEICDALDNDCNGLIDDNLTPPGDCYTCTGFNGWVLNLTEHCFIGGLCYAWGDPNPEMPCEVCNPILDPYDWTYNCWGGQVCCDDGCKNLQTDLNNCGGCGIVCDDGNPCTLDTCINGECVSENLPEGTICPGGFCDGAGNCIPD